MRSPRRGRIAVPPSPTLEARLIAQWAFLRHRAALITCSCVNSAKRATGRGHAAGPLSAYDHRLEAQLIGELARSGMTIHLIALLDPVGSVVRGAASNCSDKSLIGHRFLNSNLSGYQQEYQHHA